MVYVENNAVKNFLYYMRDGKIFVISNNLHYMISCNPVKALGIDIVLHSYMISNNPEKALG